MNVRELDDLQSRLATFAQLFGRAPVRAPNGKEEALTVAEWAPLVDIVEDDSSTSSRPNCPRS